tara:strand:+ start:2236 stop:3177 length:942 start_codon:yes stop_codon:yes gene_type:complete
VKIFVLAPKENWICDRFVSEWVSAHPESSTTYLQEADIIWLLADWCWNHLPINALKDKKVMASVHHIVPEKFGRNEQREFLIRDQIVDYYHVPCPKTHDQIRGLTSKPIYTFPFWVNQNIWTPKREQKDLLREKYGISKEAFLVGSFQRDTEGHDLKSPKLEKGPDLLCDAIIEKRNSRSNKNQTEVEVLLAGWRRQYVMNRLDQAKIKYHYNELPDLETINDFYAMLDLYIVAARYEGGPQAIFECALTNTPIISTDVGASSLILSDSSIFTPGNSLSAIPNPKIAYQNVKKYCIPEGFKNFEKAFDEICKK